MKLFKQYILKILTLVCLWRSALPVSAWNQLPLPTDSPDVLPAGRMQFDIGIQYLHHKNFPFSPFSEDFSRNVLSVPTLGLNLGIGTRAELQLQYEILFVQEDELLIREQGKSGDLAFFTKLEVLEERRFLPGVGLKFGAKLPNASNEYRVGTDETDLALLVLFQKTLASITTTCNLGLLILGNPFGRASQDDLLTYGISVAVPSTQVTYVAEITGQTFGTSHNERSSAKLHLYIYDGVLTWHLAGRIGLIANSEDWGLAGGVCITWDGLRNWFSER